MGILNCGKRNRENHPLSFTRIYGNSYIIKALCRELWSPTSWRDMALKKQMSKRMTGLFKYKLTLLLTIKVSLTGISAYFPGMFLPEPHWN